MLSNAATPGIARATALGLIASPVGAAELAALQSALEDPDPLVRAAAVRTLRFMPPEFRLQSGTARLADEVRAVRLEAAMAYADLGDLLTPAAARDLAAAIDEYRAAQNMQLNRPEAWASLGDLAVASARIEDALPYYGRALEIQPLLVPARVNLADALRQLGNDERGRQVLEDGIARVPDAAALHHALGLLLVRQRELHAALAALAKAVELEPGNARYRYVLDVARTEIESQSGETVPD